MIGLLVDSDKRSPLFPDIPTIPEATAEDLRGPLLFRSAGAGPDAEAHCRSPAAEIVRIVADAGFRHRNLIERGLEPVASTPEAFARFIREDRAASELIVKESGLQPQ